MGLFSIVEKVILNVSFMSVNFMAEKVATQDRHIARHYEQFTNLERKQQ